MSLRSQLRRLRQEILCSLYSRLVKLGDRGPIVTFTFDDFPRSALTLGGLIVEQFGGRATYYVAMGLKETINELGEQFRGTDLHSLVERGHELAGHTFSHPSARRTSVGEFLADVDRGQEAIRESITSNVSSNFAYPYGEVTLSIKRKLSPRMSSCRGTCSGFNGPDVDLNLLRANLLRGGIDQAEEAKRLVLENEKRKTWLIFYTHDVSSNPSPFGCSPELLEEIVSFAADRRVRIATVAEVMADLCPRG